MEIKKRVLPGGYSTTHKNMGETTIKGKGVSIVEGTPMFAVMYTKDYEIYSSNELFDDVERYGTGEAVLKRLEELEKKGE